MAAGRCNNGSEPCRDSGMVERIFNEGALKRALEASTCKRVLENPPPEKILKFGNAS